MASEALPGNGFTLVEVLVALVVTSLLLGIVMSGATEAAKREKRAGEKQEAILLARHLLASAAARAAMPGRTGGTEGKLAWTLEESLILTGPARRHALAGLAVTIRNAHGEKLLEAETRKLKLVVAQ